MEGTFVRCYRRRSFCCKFILLSLKLFFNTSHYFRPKTMKPKLVVPRMKLQADTSMVAAQEEEEEVMDIILHHHHHHHIIPLMDNPAMLLQLLMITFAISMPPSSLLLMLIVMAAMEMETDMATTITTVAVMVHMVVEIPVINHPNSQMLIV